MVKEKGKEKLEDSGKGKRKWGGNNNLDEDKTGGKRKSRGLLQFFDDEAYQVDEDEYSSDDSMFDLEDFFDDDFTSELNALQNCGKVPPPVTPKEEEMGEEEFERMMIERYKPGSDFVTHAADYEDKTSPNSDIFTPSAKDPNIWRVKCMVGRERYSAICLMQKYVELEKMGSKLLIISACALDHVKGFIFVEADQQNDIYEACNGMPTIYSSKMAIVPRNEIPRLFSVRNTSCAVAEGAWARIKSGRYKGDLAQVVSLNHKQKKQKKVTIKLVPRVDLKALAAKFGGGLRAQKNTIPPQRLISKRELEEFRPLIHHRRDPETNQVFEILDGMILKDGYLYKKVSLDSLIFWGVKPTDDELVKFEPAKEVNKEDAQWLSQLMKKVNKVITNDKFGKSGGASSSGTGPDVVIEDLVFFGRKDFGIVIGLEKDNTFKVMKAGSEGPVIINVKRGDMKIASFDEKLFSVSDQHSNPISVNDTVRILDGPFEDREGIIKKIYKGILFLFDKPEEENGGYLCVKANICEKLSLSCDASTGKGDRGSSDSMDVPSPKTPLSHDQSFQDQENKGVSSARHDNEMFSVGQSLRICVGPLKGYLCRVLAVRRSDITVKLDSLHKILTVKSDQLSEVRGRNSAIAQGENLESLKSFDFLNSENGTSGWTGTTIPSGDDPWNAGRSTERTSWSDFPSSNVSLSKEAGSNDCENAGKENSSWQSTKTADQDASWNSAGNSTWGQAAQKISEDVVPMTSWASGGASLVKKNDCSTAGSAGFVKHGNSSWEKDDASAGGSSWEHAAQNSSGVGNSSWEKNDALVNFTQVTQQEGSATVGKKWGNSSSLQGGSGTIQKDGVNGGWTKSSISCGSVSKSWGSGKACGDNGSWSKPKSEVFDCGASWGNQNSKSSWERTEDVLTEHEGGSSWSKNEDRSSSPWKSAREKPPDGNAEVNTKGRNDTSGNSEHTGDQGDSGWGGAGKGINDAQCIDTSWGGSKPSSDAKRISEDHLTEDGQPDSWSRGKSDSHGIVSWGTAESLSSDKLSWEKQPDTNAGGKAKGWKSTGENSNSQWGGTNQLSTWANATSAWGSKSSSILGEGNASNKNKESTSNDVSERKGGWGQGNFSKSRTNETGSSNDSWSAKGNWSSGNGFGGRCGNGRGFHGANRGGFQGRGDRGRFRGRGDRGGFLARGGRGGLQGGGDGERSRGRGGRGGRGRGDWRNTGDNSDVDNSRSWGNNSNIGKEGWKRNDVGGSWGKTGGQSWSQQHRSSWNTESSEKGALKSWNSSVPAAGENGTESVNAAAGNTAGASPSESANSEKRESDHSKELDDSLSWSKAKLSDMGKKQDASDGWGAGGSSSKEKKLSDAWGMKPAVADGWAVGGSSGKKEKPSDAWVGKSDASDGWGPGASSRKEEKQSDAWEQASQGAWGSSKGGW